MAGKFIFSLDCEGKWGGADKQHLPHNEALTEDKLRSAYRKIVDLFEGLEIPATFAFVGLFAMTQEERLGAASELEEMAEVSRYVRLAKNSMYGDGWNGEWALDVVRRSSSPHEIALHGMTHAPWGSFDRDTAKWEISLLKHAKSLSDVNTFVYPRNQVSHTDVLAEAGFIGYRAARRYALPGGSILDEFNIFSRPDRTLARSNSIEPIPSGRFVNWRHGARRAVPIWISSLRAKTMLQRMGDSDVVHFWTHPENIASAPETFEVLEAIARYAAIARDRGRVDIITQRTYCIERSNHCKPANSSRDRP